ncbi:otogelin-like protein [Falco naumanni]|uniref:otogelin-like protein n=1 Tax=Falco naumanni TaxID=148594 RepID=UPI001ADE9FCE|nr:otogelin-like protein [Falco naumanni]
MNIVGKLSLMTPWSIFLLHSLLSSLQGSYCKLSLLRRTSRNEFNATRQKRDLVTAEIQAASPRLHLHGTLTRSPPGGSCPQDCLNGAACTEAGDCDCQLFQAQGSRCQIVPNTGKDRDGICKSWGQYHFETFDGIYYYFPGNCSYIFAKDCSTPEPQYTVWVHNSPHCYGSVYTCQRSISLFFSNQEIIISGHEVRKSGIRLMLPQTVGNAFLERLADYILVKTTFGFSLAWDGNSGVYIKLTEDHKGKTCGLCGNFNGNKYDDLILQNSEYTEDISEFANSWAVQISDDAACAPTASDFSSPCSADAESTEDIFFKCQIFLQFPFLSCHESIDPYSYISSCMNDLCRVDDDETYCRAVTEYARACSHAGSPVRDWRDDFPACTEKCEDSFVHRDCISCCPPTCTFEKDCLGSNLHCLDGCYCPDGLIMENGTCISVSNCPCIYHGTAFPVGSKIEQECSNCVCIGGIWNCTDHDCPAECSITGSSHFTTFDGRHFTFLGICQYILVKGTGRNKFTVTLQKTPCGQNFDHACIESVTLVLEDDVSKQVTLTRYGQVQTGPNQVFNLNGAVEIQNISSVFVQLKTSFGLKILFAKDGERIYVQVDVSWKRRTLGLCGTYNGNLRDDFLSPAGMIEGTPQLHANAWKVSSACSVPINIPVVDPCNVNQQNAEYASHCDIINQEVFAPCHAYISPGLYYQLCRFDACKCGSSCLCNALAHYAYVCGKHGVVVDFRPHISYCAVMCHSGMLYHQCSSFCKHSCASLSMANMCGDDCAEGCNCPDGKYFEVSVNFCVSISACHCHYKGKALKPGEIFPTPTGSCQCLNGTVKCIEATTDNTVHICPEGKIYYDCRSPLPGLPAAGVNCGISCANLAMNFSCVPSPPCASGCICPPGMAEHKGKCYIPDSCPCTWKDREFLSGEVIATPCYTCVCRRGIFNCTSYPCPAVCTIYGDRHYYTFDGLEYDYVSDCQAYLLKSTDNSNISVISQNKKCFDNDIVCSKNIFITVGDTEIYFSEPSEKQKTLRGQENKSNYQLWKAGYYTVIHFPEQDITILWDRKTMMHVKVGPRWKGKLAGLCGNFDKYTSNDLTTSNNMEVRNAQVFGDSWVLGQCKSPNETLRPCEVHQSKFPYAKKECSILYSDVFAPCRNVIDVTSFVKNCHTDTCNCNLGGDCECLCTSIAAYAHKCCQQGAVVHWRSPSLCAYDCEYYNQGLGEGPYILASYGENDTIIGANVSSRRIFPLPRTGAYENVFFSFMITPGLFKDKDLSLSLVSLESAERPNYFLYVHDNETVGLEQWQASASFRRQATFFHHQGLWSPGLSAFELHSKKGFFIILTSSGVKVAKYDDSEEFKRLSSFSIEELSASVPYRRMCEWRYESCANPCVKTCSDPEGIACKFLPPVEGCLPYCPKNMILDEVTLKCVYPEDCIPVTPTESAIGTKPSLLISHTGATMERFPQTPPLFVTSGTESTHTGVTDKITMKANTTLRGMNISAEAITDFHSLEASNAATYSTFSLPSTVEPSDVLHSTASPTVLSKLISSTDFPTALQAPAVTSHTVSSTASVTLPITIATKPTMLSASPIPTRSALLTPMSLVADPFPLETLTTQLGTVPPNSALTTLTSKPPFVTSELPIGIGKSRSPSVSHSKGAAVSSEVSLPALPAGRATVTRPVFLLGSQLTLSTPTSPISSLSVRTRSGTGQAAVRPTPFPALTSTAPHIPMTPRFASLETSFPQLITVSYFETAKLLSKTSDIIKYFSTFTLNPSTSLSAALKIPIVMPSLLMPTAPETILESQSSRVPMSSPPPKTTHISIVSLGKQSSSVSSSEEDGTISAISAGIITESTTPLIMNTTGNTTSFKAPSVFAEILPSSSASLLVASGTTVVSRITTKTTDSFVADLEFYMASASVPTTTETPVPVSHKFLFTSAATQASQSAKETPQIMIMKTTGTTSPLSQMKSTSFTASEVKYATSFERTVDGFESGQTSHEERNDTKTKSPTTEKSSLPYLTVTAVQSVAFSRNTTSVKNLSLSGVPDVTASDWSKIPTQKNIKPYFSLSEPTELQTRTIIDLSHSSGGMVLTSSSEPVETQTSLASAERTTAVADKASFDTMIHALMSTSSECVPRYLEPVDKCSQYVCVNMGWMLYNLSRNCPKDVQKPDCGFRGMPVQVNTDSCCPEWECPCQCSVLSELSVITFDGNNIALCNMASYILVKLPAEIIVAHIEKCPANQSANSIRNLVPPASTSGLCFKKLNVTTRTYKLLINRLERKVVVDSVVQSLPFSKEGLSIQDTGAMYVINTPAGISIKWAHITGIIDIQYGLHSNTSMKTEGLCGVCNGDPTDDLKMQNKTIITNMEEIELFIKSWEIEKSLDVTTRRPVRNCTEDNCTYCMELLNRSIFIPCHKKVSPQEFCEKMWINSTFFWNYECDALSAYVALCNKFNICIKWRTPDYCSLSCPEGKEYQPCVQPCEAKTCLNKWFYEDSPCFYLREDCVCKNGTILHRTDSGLCIPEEKCTCTDNKGQPRSAGEIWNGSMRSCCMYNCLENGSIVAVEPECNEDPPPLCEREGEVIVHVIEESACCPKKICECNMSLCDAIIPTCKPNEKLVVGYHPLSCCPQYRCECDPSVCFNASQLDCREDQFIVEAKQEDPCCFSYLCVCESCIEPVPLCNEGEILTVDLNTIHYCCPHYYCICDENLCSEPPMNCTDDMMLVKEKIPGHCCPEWHCECSCENTTTLTCKLGEVKKIDSSVSSACGCTHYICEKDDVCIFQEVTVLNPGQSVIQYLDGGLCYTVQCLQEKDQNTGYNAMHFTMVNCSQQCEAHQIYIPSSSHYTCCGTCQNVSCSFHTENGTLIVYEEGSTWSSNCTNYKCTKTAAGAIILGSSVVCPPFNDTECTKNGGIVQMYNDGCCKTCKKEERICQKMTIRTTIRKKDCISQSPINVASCDGKCPSATIFNVNIDSHLRFCKCCRENGTRNLTVPLRCSGNGTEIMYVIQEPIDCSCQWN